MGGRRALTGVLLALAVASCDAPTVPTEEAAYEPRLFTGQIFHWPLGKTIRVYVDTSQGGAALVEHVRHAAGAWGDVVYYREFEVALVLAASAADVIVHTRLAPFLVDFPCGPPSGSGGGETYFCSDNAGTRVEVLPLIAGGRGQVKIDVSIDPGSATPPFSLRSLVTHELGHALGIGSHSFDGDDLMYGAPVVTRPSANDASTLRYLLHQPADLRL